MCTMIKFSLAGDGVDGVAAHRSMVLRPCEPSYSPASRLLPSIRSGTSLEEEEVAVMVA
jgi:hypothetical protein